MLTKHQNICASDTRWHNTSRASAQALFAAESTSVRKTLQSGSAPIIEVLLRHYEPLLRRWQQAGTLYLVRALVPQVRR